MTLCRLNGTEEMPIFEITISYCLNVMSKMILGLGRFGGCKAEHAGFSSTLCDHFGDKDDVKALLLFLLFKSQRYCLFFLSSLKLLLS